MLTQVTGGVRAVSVGSYSLVPRGTLHWGAVPGCDVRVTSTSLFREDHVVLIATLQP